MWRAFLDRWRDILFTEHPYERKVLLRLVWIRNAHVTLFFVLAWLPLTAWLTAAVAEQFPVLLVEAFVSAMTLAFIICQPVAWLGALLSADFVEHRLKRCPPPLGLGYAVAPGVLALGELEGGMMTTALSDAEAKAAFEMGKLRTLYFKDDDGNYRVATWLGDPATGRFGTE